MSTDKKVNDTRPFWTQGHHSTIYYIALPPTIPPHVQDEMLKRYRDYLCQELRHLVEPKKFVKMHRTVQSSSAASVASSVTEEGKEREVFGDDLGQGEENDFEGIGKSDTDIFVENI